MGNHNNSYTAGALSIRICFMRYVGKVSLYYTFTCLKYISVLFTNLLEYQCLANCAKLR